MHFKIQEVNRPDDMQDNCERCGKEVEELYWRDSSVYDLTVLKCPQCKTIYAYLIDYTKDDYYPNEWENTEPMNDHSAPLDKTCIKVKGIKKRTLSKKCAAAFSKDVAEQEKRSQEIDELIQNKLAELYNAGLSLATINFARLETIRRINRAKTNKKRTALLAATIYVKANGTTTDGGLWAHKGEGITERQLECIFGVTRKTIRGWVKDFV
jgi:DNA-directed RNA polymerase subunit RPC12/RpoP